MATQEQILFVERPSPLVFGFEFMKVLLPAAFAYFVFVILFRHLSPAFFISAAPLIATCLFFIALFNSFAVRWVVTSRRFVVLLKVDLFGLHRCREYASFDRDTLRFIRLTYYGGTVRSVSFVQADSKARITPAKSFIRRYEGYKWFFTYLPITPGFYALQGQSEIARYMEEFGLESSL